MTEKQRNYIMFLEMKCRENGIAVDTRSEEYFDDKEWVRYYQSYTPDYAKEIIDKLKAKLGMPIETFNPKKRRRR